MKGNVKIGDNLDSILRSHDIPAEKAFAIAKSFDTIHRVTKIKQGQTFCILSDSAGLFRAFEYDAEEGKKVQILCDKTGNMVATLLEIPRVMKIEAISGYVKSTLYDAILETEENPELIMMFSDIFQWDIDFFIDPREGDEFRIVFEKYYLMDKNKPDSLGEFLAYGKILAGQYTLGSKPFTAIYFDNQPFGDGYYDLDGNSFQKAFLKSPLNYRRISSYFSNGRKHPILKKVRPHFAIDYAAPSGTPVSAAADGIIEERGYNGGFGNYIKIRHNNSRYSTLYGHLRGFAAGVYQGQRVKQKDVIGYVGQTGLATGPHLHYAMYENNKPINPLKVKNASGDPISKEKMAHFAEVKSEFLLKLESIASPHFHKFVHIRPAKFGLARVGMSER